MSRTVLVVAAHPDDEVLGCGGAIAWHARAGDTVHILILSEGATSRDQQRDAERAAGTLDALRQACAAAAEVLGAQPPEFANCPDNRMDSIPLLNIVKRVEETVEPLRPDVVYTHHGGDLNIDHRVTHQAVVTACRPTPGNSVVDLMAFETPSSSEWRVAGLAPAFEPNLYLDISAVVDIKIAALRLYEMEMRDFPHARSIEAVQAMATTRGVQAGLAAAEAFMVLRAIRT